jgi:hypothetical protein
MQRPETEKPEVLLWENHLTEDGIFPLLAGTETSHSCVYIVGWYIHDEPDWDYPT